MNHNSFTFSYESLKNFFAQNNFVVNEKVLKIIFTYIASPRIGGVLLRGPPGVGKTAMVELLAKYLDAKLVYYQATVGTAEDDLLYKFIPNEKTKSGIEITMGPVPKALLLSKKRRVVLLIDEFDKTRPGADSLLLDVIQNFRISLYLGKKKIIKGDPKNLFIFLTSNDFRELSEPLVRRLLNVYIHPLSPKDIFRILTTSGVDEAYASLLTVIYNDTLNAGLRKPATIQELIQCYLLIKSGIDLETALKTSIIKYEDDWMKFREYIQTRRVEDNIIQNNIDAQNDILEYYDLKNVDVKNTNNDVDDLKNTNNDEMNRILEKYEKYALLVRKPEKQAEPKVLEVNNETVEVSLLIRDVDYEAYTRVVKIMSINNSLGDDAAKIGKFEFIKLANEEYIIAKEPLKIDEVLSFDITGGPIEAYYEDTIDVTHHHIVEKLIQNATRVRYATKTQLALESKDLCEEKMVVEIRENIINVKGYVKCDDFRITATRLLSTLYYRK